MSKMQNELNKDLPSVTMLRGIASLAVCLMHFMGTVQSNDINDIGQIGGNGVSIFFLISGFILPYALFNSSYTIKNYFTFLLKRIVRIDPPYLITIFGIIALTYLAQFSPFHTVAKIEIFDKNIAYHLFYLVDIAGGKWLNIVFWTLAIEFQFYLLIGLLFPLLLKKRTVYQIIAFSALCLIPFVFNDERFVLNFLLMFLPGMLLFCYKTKQIDLKAFVATIVIAVSLGFIKIGLSGILVPMLSIAFILFVKKPIKPLIFLGTISYSLYLLHTPIGTDGIINFLQNYIVSESGRIYLMLSTLPIIFFVAWIFYRFVEKPSIKMAKSFKYKGQRINNELLN